VEDFIEVAGLGRDAERTHVSTNESLSFETISALLYLNASKEKDNKELRRRIVAKGRKRNGRRIPMLTKVEAKEFYGRFRESNAQFFSKYIDKDLAIGFSIDFAAFPDEFPQLTAKETVEFVFGATL
jgi:hypothetical protein